MKNTIVFTLLMLFVFASCKKEEDSSAPVITRIRTLSKTDTVTVTKQVTLDSSVTTTSSMVVAADSTITSGSISNQYGIVGQHLKTTMKIYINGVSIYFNPTLVTDELIIFTIPTTVSYSTSTTTNKITVVTMHGSVDYDFTVAQPAAVISSFTPAAGDAGTEVTITGTYFDNLTGVKFGDVTAEIVSSTSTQIVVKVPDGIVQEYIYVTTPGGTSSSATKFGFQHIIYDDALAANWADWSWSVNNDFANTSPVKRGTYSIKAAFTSGWGGVSLANTGSAKDLSSCTALKISIYGGADTDGNTVNIVVNSDYSNVKTLTLTAGKWTDYTVLLTEVGSPTTLTSLVIQESSGTAETIYLDDIGFL
ncbi:MAG: hypothetical protein H6Q26_2645 [Bacteroidetes bacterium]|uniref:IPT/TIG domain-containing protein n=1 Tax=unclassified Chitinophaga TaxID=2619133 RepID=UPI0009CBBFB7|nr:MULTISPECIES: IPT/TIG domain-containing protein [unclassified Chitinophaga]MBP1652488.1 hypothetical protein [Bacteroidota bacterium]OMP75273.1 hypothetical protein BW716_31045 [[Flexibacter] sp. ATCC 35208]OMP75840.1 hypothetical protein BW716_28110 [[Flexibacter] sp. ATCC 35208]WPV66128.1 IPT/TIG domain-containing protein [Chitinophaga sp. LS1]